VARLPLQLRALDGNWEPTLGVEPVTPATIAGVRSFMKSIEIYARGALDRFIAQTLARQRENPRALTSGVPRLTAPARPVGHFGRAWLGPDVGTHGLVRITTSC
jgi:hypothetical protein